MKTRLRKSALLLTSGAVIFQLGGCGAQIATLATDQIVGTLVGTLLTSLLSGVLGSGTA